MVEQIEPLAKRPAPDEDAVLAQLAATREAAIQSNSATLTIFTNEIGKVRSDPAVATACSDIVDKNETTIIKCNAGIEAIILAGADVDAWLSTLNDFTNQLEAQTERLNASIKALNQVKKVASAIAGLLSRL